VTAPALRLDGLTVVFPGGRRRASVTAVEDVSLAIEPGEVLTLLGESGSGKSATLHAIAGLLAPDVRVSGALRLAGRSDNLLAAGADRGGIAGRRVGMIFQNPGSSLNPVVTVGAHIDEVIATHHGLGRRAARRATIDLLSRVGLPGAGDRADAFAHQLSGGQKQRVAIAAALAGDPAVLLADEPTTALDATVQARILDLLLELVDERRIAMIFVTHDLAVGGAISDRIGVMRAGRLVESGPASRIARAPAHPYTARLVSAALPFTRAADGVRAAPAPERPEDPDAGTRQGGLVLEGLRRVFAARGAPATVALDGVDLIVRPGEIVGLIGESGSGKTTLGRIAVGLDRPDSGRVSLDGEPLDLSRPLPRHQRGALQLVFQDPLASFNPRRTIAEALHPSLRLHQGLSGPALSDAVDRLLSRVELDPALGGRRPSRLSGGELQRAAIARALAAEPRILVCDEAVASLDVSVRSQILDLLESLRAAQRLGLLFISHDLAVVQRIADRTVVLHHGRVVESGSTRTVLTEPREAYTRSLVAAVPESLVPWRGRHGAMSRDS